MGIRRPFDDLGALLSTPSSHFVEARQSVDIRVDKYGIRADATNIMGGIYGGMLAAQPKFSMELNRPFAYLIYERFTDALLFAGAVVDPASE